MKIRLTKIISAFAFFFFFLAAGTPVIAQIGPGVSGSLLKICDRDNFVPGDPPANPNCDAGSVEVTFGEDGNCNSGYLEMALYCVDLYANPEIGVTYQWPALLPQMILQYQYSESPEIYIQSEPVVNWEFLYSINDHNLFQGKLIVQPEALQALNCGGSDEVSYYDFPAKIVYWNSSASEYLMYPIESYGNSNQIFSCEVFTENCGFCIPSCESLPPSYNIKACIDCGRCDVKQGPVSQSRLSANSSFELSPNPFADEFTIDYFSELEQTIEIKMFDLQGKVILEKIYTVNRGKNKIEFLTNSLNAGVYLVQLNDGKINQTQQIMKLKE